MPGFAWHHAASFKKMARIIQTHMLRAQQDVAHASSTVIVVDDKGYVDQGVVASHELFMADVLSQFQHGPPAVGSIKILHQILDGTVPAFGTGRYRPRILEDPRALAVHLELFQTQLPKQALCAGPSEGNPFIAEGWARKSQAGGGPR